MALSAHSYATFQTEAHPGILHMALGGGGILAESSIETVAEFLADSVYECNPDKHDGRGRKHTSDEVEAAYKSAIYQIQNTDFEEEWRIAEWKEHIFKKWNGSLRTDPYQKLRPVPAAVLMPVDGMDDWRLVMPDRQGNPIMQQINDRAKKAIAEVIPRPTSDIAHPGIIGYRTKALQPKRWSLGPTEA